MNIVDVYELFTRLTKTAIAVDNLELREQIVELRKVVLGLEEENHTLRAKIVELEKSKDRPIRTFVEKLGVWWHVEDSGNVEEDPFCPKCVIVMSESEHRLACTKCAYKVSIAWRERHIVRDTVVKALRQGEIKPFEYT